MAFFVSNLAVDGSSIRYMDSVKTSIEDSVSYHDLKFDKPKVKPADWNFGKSMKMDKELLFRLVY